MAGTSEQCRRMHGSGVRRFLAVLGAVVLGAPVVLTGAQPAAAATPWLTVSDGFASFRVPAADLESAMGAVSRVVVEADFGPSFTVSDLGLTRSGDAWTSVIGPLRPGLYQYRLRGDDTRVVKDPTNPTTVTSDPTWSTFLVPGDAARLLADVPDGQGGAMGTVTYQGDPGQTRSATVWTPPGYDAHRREPYPVLYLQQGADGSRIDWLDFGRAKQILDNLAVRRRIEPMVVVLGDGSVSDFQRELRTVARAVRREYNIARDPAHQALAGASAGGTQVLRSALSHPGQFAYVGSFAGPLADEHLRIDGRAVNAAASVHREHDRSRVQRHLPDDAHARPGRGQIRLRRGRPRRRPQLERLAGRPRRLLASAVPPGAPPRPASRQPAVEPRVHVAGARHDPHALAHPGRQRRHVRHCRDRDRVHGRAACDAVGQLGAGRKLGQRPAHPHR